MTIKQKMLLLIILFMIVPTFFVPYGCQGNWASDTLRVCEWHKDSYYIC